MIVWFTILSMLQGASTTTAAQQVDRRTFGVIDHASTPATHSVYLQLADNLPGAADRSARAAVHRLADGLYVHVRPQGHTGVARGAFAYSFTLSRDAAGTVAVAPTDQPAHGPSADYVRAADFRNSDNSGPNAIGPKNVNAAGELRAVTFAEYVMEIRVLSFEIVGLGPSSVPAFSQFSCLVTIKVRLNP